MTIGKSTILFSLFLVLAIPFTVTAQECFAVIVSGGVSRPFWSDVVDGAVKAGEELNVKLYIRGTINDKDAPGQKIILNTFMSNYQCQGLVIAPSDHSRNEDIAQLSEKNIPTVYIDRDTGGKRIASVTTDNYAAGKLAAKKMAQVLNYHGKVLLLRLQKGVASTDAREAGFTDEAQHLGLEIVADPHIGTRVGEARSIVADTFQNIEKIDGIFTPNDTTTIATILVREQLNVHQDAVLIGFDEDPFIIDSLKKRKLTGYITQSPYQIGYQGVYTLYNALYKNIKATDVKTPVIYVDK